MRILAIGDRDHTRGSGWLRFTRDGRILSGGEGGVRLWDVEAGAFQVLNPRADHFTSTPRAPRVCAGSSADLAHWSCHDLESSRSESLDLSLHGAQATEFALDPTGTRLVSGDSLGVVRVGPVTREPPHLLLGHEGAVLEVAVSPDGGWLASAGYDGTVRLWPMPDVTQPPLHTLPHEQLLETLAALTNLRALEDEDSPGGYRIEPGPCPGWARIPTW